MIKYICLILNCGKPYVKTNIIGFTRIESIKKQDIFINENEESLF